MNKIIEKYSHMKSGLVLVDLPTGTGKTHGIKQYIKKNLEEELPGQILYITNNHINLPYDDILSIIDPKFYDKVLLLKPYYQNIVDNLGLVEIEDAEILESKEYKRLKYNIEQLIIEQEKVRKTIDSEEKLNYTQKFYLEFLRDRIASQYEPEFRTMIKNMYFHEKTQSEKERFIKDNEWLQILYPTCILDRFNVILMTTKKFVYKVDTFKKRPFYLYNSDFIENNMVFIDEFDGTKSVMLNHIIDEDINTKIDIFKLFLGIYSTLKELEFPSVFMDINLQGEEGVYESIESIIQYQNRNFEKYYSDLNMQYLVKTEQFNDKKSFLFDEFCRITVHDDSKHKLLFVKTDEENKYNYIFKEFSSKIDTENTNSLTYYIKGVHFALDSFYRSIHKIANIVYSITNKLDGINDDTDNYATREETIWSIISMFNISDEMHHFVYSKISSLNDKDTFRNEQHLKYVEKFEDEEIKEYQIQFHRKGFSFTIVQDSVYHKYQSKVKNISFKTTPEDILLKLSNRSLVFGISATSTIKSVINNYDLTYIENQLEESLIIIDENDYKLVQERLDLKEQASTNKAEVCVGIIDADNVLDERDFYYTELFNETIPEVLRDNYAYLQDTKTFDNEHVIKIANTYMKMIHKGIMSLVYFLNKLPKDNDPFNKKDIVELCYSLSDHYKKERINIYVVASYNYKIVIEKVKEKLLFGEKVMILSTYRTLGTGKNIQYDYDSKLFDELGIISTSTEKNEKDFDAVFLTTPTHLVQRFGNYRSSREYVLSNFLFQQQYLFFKNKDKRKTFEKNIEKGFRAIYYNENKPRIEGLEEEIALSTSAIIVQAIGRICRTSTEVKKIHIFTERDVVKKIQSVKSELEKSMHNYEFKELLNYKLNSLEEDVDIEYIDMQSKKSFGKITSNAWNVRRSINVRKHWIELRNFVLRFPTTSFVPNEFIDYYMNFPFKLRKYSYDIEYKPYRISKLHLDNSGKYSVSHESCEIDNLLQMDLFKNIDSNKVSRFKASGKYIMTPSTFKMIYKGALGEYFGYRLFKATGIVLNEIKNPKEFELFDYEYNSVMVDFKFWSTFHPNFEKEVNKVVRKLNKTKGRKALIINLIKHGDHRFVYSKSKNMLRIPYLLEYSDNKILRINKDYLDEAIKYLRSKE